MHWNYRVIQFTYPNQSYYYSIHEVHYSEYGTPVAYTETPADVYSSTVEGMNDVYAMIGSAFSRPILKESDFTSEKEEDEDDLESTGHILSTENDIINYFNTVIFKDKEIKDG